MLFNEENMTKVLLSVFTLWLAIEGSVSVDTLVSIPASVNGVLTACTDQEISLTCSHDNVFSGGTIWIASSPVNCMTIIGHIGTNPLPSRCGPFMFQNVTPQSPVPLLLNSTAVATTTINMTDTNVECREGNAVLSSSVDNISLCIIDRLRPPTNLTCINITNGLNVFWEAVNDTSCAMSDIDYHITVVRESDMMTIIESMSVTETTAELTNIQGLEPDTMYSIYVYARTLVGSCGGDEAIIACETSASVPIVTTSRLPVLPTTYSSQGPASPPVFGALSTGAIIGIVVGILVIIIILVLVNVIMIVVIKSFQGGKKGSDRAPLEADTEQHHGPVYAMVNKLKEAPAEQPTYQAPNSIERVQAPAGDLYTTPQQKVKGKSQGSFVDPESANVAPEYSVVQKKDQQLTYAAIQVEKGNDTGQQQTTGVLYSDIQHQ